MNFSHNVLGGAIGYLFNDYCIIVKIHHHIYLEKKDKDAEFFSPPWYPFHVVAWFHVENYSRFIYSTEAPFLISKCIMTVEKSCLQWKNSTISWLGVTKMVQCSFKILFPEKWRISYKSLKLVLYFLTPGVLCITRRSLFLLFKNSRRKGKWLLRYAHITCISLQYDITDSNTN